VKNAASVARIPAANDFAPNRVTPDFPDEIEHLRFPPSRGEHEKLFARIEECHLFFSEIMIL
jgi:hypothetical protein